MDTPQYIKALVTPNGSKPKGRKVWSVDLENTWLPFFTATNVTGDTQIPSEALGAPLRLAYQADGSVKFSNAGRPVIRVAKDIQEGIKLIRENFVAGLHNFVNEVVGSQPDEYRLQVEASQKAGQPIVERDRGKLTQSLLDSASEIARKAEAQAQAQAEAQAEVEVEVEVSPEAKAQAEAEAKAQAEVEAKAQAEAEAKAQAGTKPKTKAKELVTA